jgi:hypothetical protein
MLCDTKAHLWKSYVEEWAQDIFYDFEAHVELIQKLSDECKRSFVQVPSELVEDVKLFERDLEDLKEHGWLWFENNYSNYFIWLQDANQPELQRSEVEVKVKTIKGDPLYVYYNEKEGKVGFKSNISYPSYITKHAARELIDLLQNFIDDKPEDFHVPF